MEQKLDAKISTPVANEELRQSKSLSVLWMELNFMFFIWKKQINDNILKYSQNKLKLVHTILSDIREHNKQHSARSICVTVAHLAVQHEQSSRELYTSNCILYGDVFFKGPIKMAVCVMRYAFQRHLVESMRIQ